MKKAHISIRIFCFLVIIMTSLPSGISNAEGIVISSIEEKSRPVYSLGKFKEESIPCAKVLSRPAATTSRVLHTGLSWDGTSNWLVFRWVDNKGIQRVSFTDQSRLITMENKGKYKLGMGYRHSACWVKGDQHIHYAPDVLQIESQYHFALSEPVGDIQLSPITGDMVYSLPMGQRIGFYDTVRHRDQGTVSIGGNALEMRWCPNGRSIAILSGWSPEAQESPFRHLYTYDRRLQRISPLVSDQQVRRNCWAWSADGKSIYYTEERLKPSSASRLWKIDVATRSRTLLMDLTELGYPVQTVLPSPNGDAFLLVRKVGDKIRELRLVCLKSRRQLIVAKSKPEEGFLWLPAWSPTGRSFAVVIQGRLWMISSDGQNANKVFPN